MAQFLQRIKTSFHLYAWITIIFWALAFVLTKLALQHFSAFGLGFIRYFMASIALIIFLGAKGLKLPAKEDFWLFVAAGATGFFFYMVSYNQGQALVSAATASIIVSTVPVITVLLARIIWKEKLKLHQWAATILEFAGVFVISYLTGKAATQNAGGFTLNIGLVWLIGAAISSSIYNLLQKELTKRYSARRATAWGIFFGAVMLGIFAPKGIPEAISAPAIQWIYLLLLSIGSGAIAYIAWTKAFSLAEHTSDVSNYMFLTPLITAILGFLLAHEIPDFATIIGGGIILTGMAVFNFWEKIWNFANRVLSHLHKN